MSDGKPVKGWWLFVLVAVGFLGLVGGGLVAFLGSAAAEDAADQLASARSRLAAEESEVAGGELRVAAAEQALAIVRVTLTSAIDSRKTAEARVVDAEEVLDTAESALAEADATRARTEGAVLAFYSVARTSSPAPQRSSLPMTGSSISAASSRRSPSPASRPR